MKLPDGIKMTPMLKQYSEWKDKYPDCLLLFRMGDFFELFFDDAVIASEVLDITLTARDQDKAIPMAGVPHHALDAYIGRLIAAGYRVAVCDQITEPDGKTLVERAVIRVVTPGTYVPQDEDLDGRLAAAAIDGDYISIALLTTGTGRLEAGSFPRDEALALLFSFFASSHGELLLPKGQEEVFPGIAAELLSSVSSRPSIVVRERGEFGAAFGAAWLCRRWNISSLRAMGIEDSDASSGAAAAALRYLEETQFGASGHVLGITPLLPGGTLILDQTTQTNLELTEGEPMSLYSVLNRCKTPMGRRLLREWITHPLADLERIGFRHDCVELLSGNASLLRRLASTLAECGDMERALGRLCLRVGNPRDLGIVRDTLRALPGLRAIVEESASPRLSEIFKDVPDLGGLSDTLCRALRDELPRTVKEGGVIRDGYSAELDGWRDATQNASERLREFEASERERTGIKVRVNVNKVFGYYIEVGKSFVDRVPEDYIRRQTVASGERYVNEALKEIERRVFRAESEIGACEEALWKELLETTLGSKAGAQSASTAIATLDALCSLGAVARDNGYVRPVMDDSRVFDVRGARHPVVERCLGTLTFTPNDIVLDPDGDECIAIITGPNMAGKSTYLRTAALIGLMAHVGSFVSAESARIGLLDRIFTRIGARDELARGRSTFMVEMVETANILRHAGPRSLIVLDEIGRGTSTYDGMSIAWAVIEFLSLHIEGRTKALFATHYHELTGLPHSHPGLTNLSMAVEESSEGIRFLHKVEPKAADRSYGIEVARLAGVPRLVIRRSQELLAKFEENGEAGGKLSAQAPKPAQMQIFFDVEREGVIERLAQCDPNQMTPIEALDMIFTLREKCRGIMGLK